MSRKRLIVLSLLALPLLAVLAAGGLLFTATQTGFGREILRTQIETLVSEDGGLQLSLGDIDGNLLSSFEIASVSLADSQGAWLTAKDLKVDWSPGALLDKRLEISKIDLAKLDVLRDPQLPPSPSSQEGTDGDIIPSLPLEIALQALDVRQIRLHEALAGQEAIFRLGLSLNAPIAEGIRSEIDLRQLEGGQAALAGQIEFHPRDRSLGVDITLSEPENGLLAHTLGLPGGPPVEVSILGDGPVTSWQGQLLAQAGDLFESDLIVSTSVSGAPEEPEIGIALQGSSRFAPLLPAELAPLVEPRLTIDSRLTWSASRQSLGIASAILESSALRVEAEGDLDLPNEDLSAKLAITPLDTSVLKPLIAPAGFRSGEIGIAVSGSLQSLESDIDLRLQDVTLSDGAETISAREVTGRFQTTLSPGGLDSFPLEGQARLSAFDGLPPEVTALLGEALDLDFKLQLDGPENQLNISEIKAAGAGLALAGSGQLGLETQAATVDLSLVLTDLALLAPSLGQAIAGQMNIGLQLESGNFEEEAKLHLSATTENLDPGDAQLRPLIGEEIELDASLNATPEAISVNSLALKTAFAAVTARGELPTSFETLEADFEVQADSLAPLQTLAGAAVEGVANIAGKLSGPLDDPALAGTARLETLRVDGIELGNLSSSYEVQALTSAPNGQLESRLEHPKATADLASNFALSTPDRLELTDLALTIGDAALGGDLTVPLTGLPLTGALKGEVPNLAALTALAEQAADGALTFDIALSGEEARQDVRIEMSGKNLQADGQDPDSPVIAALNATITGRDLLRQPRFEAKAEATQATAGAFTLDSLRVDAEGTEEAADFSFGLQKAAEPALTLDGGGRLELTADTTTLILSALDGRYEDRPLALRETSVLRQSGPQTRLESFRLDLDGGDVSGSAEVNTDAANATLTVSSLPLDLLALLDPGLSASGTLEGQANFAVAGGTASGDFRFEATGAKPASEDFAGLPALNGEITGTLANERLSFDAKVAGLEDTAIDATGSLPLEISLTPFAAVLPETAPIELSAKLDGDLARLWPLLKIDEHLLAGRLSADLQARGSLSSPNLQGTASLSEGRYESLELGTLLTDMAFAAELDGLEKIDLSFTAQDGDDGGLTAEGVLSLPANGAEPALDIAANLARARLLRRDDILAQASGDLQVAGPLSALAVTGDIASDLVEINIGGNLPPSIVDLPVEERNRPGEAADSNNGKREVATSNSTTALDLSLSLPRRVFIRGRGLDSEWSGQFKITGTADAPVIEGDLSPVRGNFTFAGKSFALQTGKVSIASGDEIDPDLDLSAVYEANGFKAIVAITGTASSPEIGLSSEPELPQDEILAQVLFGKSTGQLSPVEALQLAEAVASVSGQLGSGEGILGLVRKTIGVDVLTAGTNETSGEVEVRAGKYVTDEVFLGVSQGTDPTSTKVTVEVEVTPNISVESDVGQDASGRVGVFWKFDY